MSPRSLLWIALLVATALIGWTPALAGDEARLLPSETCQGLFLVPVVYGEETARTLLMVLDTGAGGSSVDPDAVERVFGKRVKAGRKINLRDGAIGALKIGKLPVTLHEMDALGRALGREIDGILGFPTFRSLLLTLDYGAGEVRVQKGSLPPVDGETIFKDVGKNRPYLAVELGGDWERSRVPVLIDSGSTGAFTLRRGDPLLWKIEPRPFGASVRYNGIRVREGGRLAGELRLGPTRFPQPLVELADGTRLAGYKTLRGFALTFDQKKRRIRMLAAAGEPVHLDPLYGVSIAFRPVEAGLEVVRLFLDEHETQLREGDIVVSMNGTPVYERGCEPAVPSEEAIVPVELLRDGRTLQLAIAVQLLVP